MKTDIEPMVMHGGRWITLDEFQLTKRKAKTTICRGIRAIVYLSMAAAVGWIVIPGVWNIIRG